MISLRLATKEDMSLVLAWRNNPDIYQWFYTQKAPIPWEEHEKWWNERPSSWWELIIELDFKRPIGVVCVGQLEHWSPELGIMIGNPTDWGKGYAKEALLVAMMHIKHLGKTYCHTTIKKDNINSIEIFKKLGFVELGDARPGEVWLTKKL